MNGTQSFTFSATLEPYLNNVKSRKRQAIFRIYLDYPNCCPDGQYNTGVPDFLLTGANPVTFTSYPDYGGGKSPDYSNERLVSSIEQLIAELARKYDGDNRIAYVQVGILGYWGEFHTYPNTTLMAPLATRLRVLSAFYNNFNITKLLVSQDSMQYFCPPLAGTTKNAGCDVSVTSAPYPTVSYPSIGFHDDAFADSTYSATSGKDYYFYNRLQSRIPDINSFLTASNGGKGGGVMGGELYPSYQSKIFKTTWTGQDFSQCVKKTNATWLLNDYVFSTLANSPTTEWYAARNASLMLGYAFTLRNVEMTSITSTSLTLTFGMENIGSAPFPYLDINLAVYLKNATTKALIASNEATSIYQLTPASGSQNIKVNLKWSTPITTSPYVYVNLKSKQVPSTIPIAFAVSGAPTDGSDFLVISTVEQISTNGTTPTPSPTPSPQSSVKTSSSTGNNGGIKTGNSTRTVSESSLNSYVSSWIIFAISLIYLIY
ncbi:predicted protein [Naegleria gruberi]|uniref:Predicted protein n=1 Tax=Naegleria gruberi TaxID=5762 RepID=D2VZ43_NAEGR|nr:uncharacterized protein NAEGRDRAFT_74352 [Naegleria gruberi]EFC37877.1 predicted protein [Naegleria gruberi]|eukprot:XP_002670621.1 predicted protein [Naegleria gruberi strain NEG-M]